MLLKTLCMCLLMALPVCAANSIQENCDELADRYHQRIQPLLDQILPLEGTPEFKEYEEKIKEISALVAKCNEDKRQSFFDGLSVSAVLPWRKVQGQQAVEIMCDLLRDRYSFIESLLKNQKVDGLLALEGDALKEIEHALKFMECVKGSLFRRYDYQRETSEARGDLLLHLQMIWGCPYNSISDRENYDAFLKLREKVGVTVGWDPRSFLGTYDVSCR